MKDVNQMLADLRQERKQIEEAILGLERLAASRGGRGRPPAWLVNPRKGLDPGGGPRRPTKELRPL